MEDVFTMWLVGQILIGIGYAVYIISRFLKTKKNMLLWDNLSRVTDVVGYILFGNINGIEHTIFGIVRNEAYRHITQKVIKHIAFVILLAVIGIMYGFAFEGISTVFFIVGNVSLLVSTAYGNEQGVRLGTIGACICNIPAFLLITNYTGLVGEAICLVMTIIAYFKDKEVGVC